MSDARTHAIALDAADPLRGFRQEFLIPRHKHTEQVYFCGNSLGLQPKGARKAVEQVLDKWAHEAVEGHFRGQGQWMTYHEQVREPLARVVGALPSEVVAMNTLTANLHFMMVSFYRPTRERPAILIEAGAFPSDRHAVESQIRFHGFDPATDLIELEPDEAEGTISMAALEAAIAMHGHRLALVLWPGIQYRTGQAFDLAEVARLAHAAGAVAGFDLAHAVGNLPLALHDADADFAVWCHYKYLNAGPGAVAGAFVHARHAHTDRPRFAGWWGHEKQTRFLMAPQFTPTPGAEGWQLSNPPVLAMAPLLASLALVDRAGGMAALREKSEQLTGFLEELIEARVLDTLEIITPAEPERRGCQLSLRVAGGRERGRELFDYLVSVGVLGDWREPDVIRISPVPLYNSFKDVYRFVEEVELWRGV
ncbi:kynureninase [Pseudoxanthomonas winnipegensis]|uniref:Kynureninase n=1 Tax=Pseudoxanthomonas winnipegensis TaxID=2480810 RepID=A0A4Q8LIN2_9GAMM|nr:kynureninase [Pseudoxanthomonas winnipegensis]RZZ87671.1 kynureninase [Pseudoxanthomonas winnipegensis]TAA29809.1 kynureninase [Pseudoxanthomonas winnipegensis]TAA40642.1 kynureninase [Pseudoxanthomonas winnipegensis]TBV77947.1 kynureninase [Pseudoxanthomonas winnipegensis]